MITIRISNEFLHGPIWACEQDSGIELAEKPSFIVDDPQIRALNEEIGDLFNSYYEFDSHDRACWFDEERERADKGKMLGLLTALRTRLDELNDGSFEIEDLETERVSAL